MKKILLSIMGICAVLGCYSYSYEAPMVAPGVTQEEQNQYYQVVKSQRPSIQAKLNVYASRKGMEKKTFYRVLIKAIDRMSEDLSKKEHKAILLSLKIIINEEVFGVEYEQTEESDTSVDNEKDTSNPSTYKDDVFTYLEVRRTNDIFIKDSSTYRIPEGASVYNFSIDKTRISRMSDADLEDMTLMYVTNDRQWVLVDARPEEMADYAEHGDGGYDDGSSGDYDDGGYEDDNGGENEFVREVREIGSTHDGYRYTLFGNINQGKVSESQVDGDVVYTFERRNGVRYYPESLVAKMNIDYVRESGGAGISMSSYDGYLSYLGRETSTSNDEATQEAEQIYREIVAQTNRLVDNGMSDDEKVQTIYTWLANNKVDYSIDSIGAGKEYAQAFYVWENDAGVCEGVNELYASMLEIAGVDGVSTKAGSIDGNSHVVVTVNGQMTDLATKSSEAWGTHPDFTPYSR